MTKKAKEPINFPTMICKECNIPVKGYEKWTHDDEGRLFLVGVDMWPEYFKDVLGYRIEFCSAKCGLQYTNNRKKDSDTV